MATQAQVEAACVAAIKAELPAIVAGIFSKKVSLPHKIGPTQAEDASLAAILSALHYYTGQGLWMTENDVMPALKKVSA